MTKRNNGGFSWGTFFGITATKRKISRATGIPFTKTGRDAKLGSWLMKLLKFKGK